MWIYSHEHTVPSTAASAAVSWQDTRWSSCSDGSRLPSMPCKAAPPTPPFQDRSRISNADVQLSTSPVQRRSVFNWARPLETQFSRDMDPPRAVMSSALRRQPHSLSALSPTTWWRWEVSAFRHPPISSFQETSNSSSWGRNSRSVAVGQQLETELTNVQCWCWPTDARAAVFEAIPRYRFHVFCISYPTLPRAWTTDSGKKTPV